VDLITD